MRICVYGAGAVGGSLAVRLHDAGSEVSLVARGAHAEAIRTSGLTLVAGETHSVARIRCVGDPDELPPQDVVVVAVKATQLGAIAKPLSRMLAARTHVMFAMNGVPWWFGAGVPASLVERLDPGAGMRNAVALEQIIGAVIYSSNEVVAPGVIRNYTPQRNRVLVGRPNGRNDPLVEALAGTFRSAGYDAQATSRIREEIWTKMLIVASASPVAALTGAPLSDLASDPGAFSVMSALMHEGASIGCHLGFAMPDDLDARLAFYRDKPVRPSLLQDFEARREPELDSGILAFCDIAAEAGVDVPVMRSVAALLRMKARAIATPP